MSSLGVRVNWENGELIVTVSGTGDAAQDDANISEATHMLNSHRGGTLMIQGTVHITHSHDFTQPVSIIGVGPYATLAFRTATAAMLSWNRSWQPRLKRPFPINVSAGQSLVTHTGSSGHAPAEEGDWVILWSDDMLPVAPHFLGGSQHPMEIHLAENVLGNRIFLNDPAADDMEANAHGLVLPKAVICDGIVIDNLTLHWDGGPMPDYATALFFNACTNVTITDRVRTTRQGPGAIWFSYCGNCTCNMRINGTARDNGVYGIVAGVVNGLDIDGVFRGTRHVFTTTSGIQMGRGRWGTPLNVVFDGLVYCSPENRATVTRSRTAFDTHPEGYGIICKADFVGAAQPGAADHMAQSRSRGTLFQGCTFRGSSVQTSIGVRLLAKGCAVHGCQFNSLWGGVRIDADDTRISSSMFENITGPAVNIYGGAGSQVVQNSFADCGQRQGISPPYTKSVVRVASPVTPLHRFHGNVAPKYRNDNFIDVNDNPETAVEIAGNTLTGYGTGRIGVEPSNPAAGVLESDSRLHNVVD